MLEPLGQSQVLGYLRKLSDDATIHLISFEKPSDWAQADKRQHIAQDISQSGIIWHPLTYHKTPSALATAFDIVSGFLVGLWLILRFRLNIIHARSYVPAVMALGLKSVLRCKFIFDMRGFWADERVDGGLWPRDGRLYHIAKWFERRFLLSADKVVSLTAAAVREMDTFSYLQHDMSRFVVIPTCADLDRFNLTKRLGKHKPFVLGYVGSAGTWYLFDEVVACFVELLTIKPDAHFLILNKGEHAFIRQKLTAAGIAPQAFTLTEASHRDVHQFMENMSATIFFIKPVFSKIASSPTKLGEFLGCGVPCLSNVGVGDMAEILTGDGVGIALADFNNETLKQGVRDLLALAAQADIAERCRASALKRFSLEDGPLAPAIGYRNIRLVLEISNSIRLRLGDLMGQARSDLNILYGELCPFMLGMLECASMRNPYIYDFDDAFYLKYGEKRSKPVQWLLGNKFDTIISGAAAVTAGSAVLAGYARNYNDNVVDLPTVVDVERYLPDTKSRNGDVFTIGWIGSPSTAPYLEALVSPLSIFGKERPTRLVVIGGKAPYIPNVEIVELPWSEDTEVALINSFDVGVMPLPDNVVGTDCGILADTSEQWLAAFRTLSEDRGLRERLGDGGASVMCGFAGLFTPVVRDAEALSSIGVRMASAIIHRGPDDSGVWADEAAGLCLSFRRLAIVDLTSAGHQPMHSANNRYVIVFNGEIYNHLAIRAELEALGQAPDWRGHSDTETLLAAFVAWGVAPTLQRAVGMFALALWDRKDRVLTLGRDRMGEKPLYYGWTGQEATRAFVFGSELKALRAFPGFNNDVSRDALALYMQFCAVPAPYSIYEGIYKLEQGHILAFAPTQDASEPLRSQAYWQLADAARQGQANLITDEADAVNQLGAALSEAVKLQSIADVPLGAFLSGGVDSSTIVALMQAQSSRPVKTFTIGFDEAGFDEAPHAAAVAKHLGTDHHELRVGADDAKAVIPLLPHLYDEPFADSSQIPTYLVSKMTRQHVTVALSGDAGDELFAGYNRYFWGDRIWSRVNWMPLPLRHGLGKMIENVPVATWDKVGDVLGAGRFVNRLGDKAHKLARRFKTVGPVDDLYRSLVTEWPYSKSLVPGAKELPTRLDDVEFVHSVATPQERMMLLDSATYLPDDILVKVDRAAMGVSLETRVPFLDHRIVELSWRIPLSMKIRQGQGKWILRQLLYQHVPRELIERPKAGFAIPVGAWLRGPLKDWAEQLLDENRLKREGYFDPSPIRQAWTEHLSGRRDWTSRLWCILMFQAWLEVFNSNGAQFSRVIGFRWLFVILLFATLIGYRYEIGPDWNAYIDYLLRNLDIDFADSISQSDPGYQALNWLSGKLDFGIFGVNFLGGLIFMLGLVTLCVSQPQPWLALVVSVPYLVNIVAMGYTRQAVALGLVMAALSALIARSTLIFVGLVLIGATFHKSAVIVLPLAAFASTKNKVWTSIWIAATASIAYYLFLASETEYFYSVYIVTQYQSDGTLLHVEMRLWLSFSMMAFLLVLAFILSPSSTAVDRVGLYILPLQLVVFSQLPGIFGSNNKANIAHVSAVAGLGYIFTSNDTKAVILKPLVTRIMKFALSGARSQTILQNPDDVKLFLDNKIVALEKISLILGSGVDLTRFTEKQIDNASLFSPMRVLLAARLLREKGILEFVEASEPDPGNPASIEESTVVGWDQEGAVKWLRHVEDMPALLKGCDIFVLPTYYGEGVPKSLIEAAACSLALVTTDMPGCREVVTHEVDGLLVPVKNARGLADAIARFLDDRQFSNAMGQAARLKAIQLFDERIVIAKTLDGFICLIVIYEFFLINLNRSPDRLKNATHNLQRVGLDFERIEAVDGSKLDLSAENPVINHNAIKPHKWITPAVIDAEWALVMEDDVELFGGVVDVLNKAATVAPRDAVTLLYFHGQTKHFTKTGAYLIHRSLAEKLCSFVVPVHTSADNWAAMHRANVISGVWAVLPPISKPAYFGSDIGYGGIGFYLRIIETQYFPILSGPFRVLRKFLNKTRMAYEIKA
eukprot:gene16825-17006_t